MGGFRKIGRLFWGVPLIRIIGSLGSILGCPYFGKPPYKRTSFCLNAYVGPCPRPTRQRLLGATLELVHVDYNLQSVPQHALVTPMVPQSTAASFEAAAQTSEACIASWLLVDNEGKENLIESKRKMAWKPEGSSKLQGLGSRV